MPPEDDGLPFDLSPDRFRELGHQWVELMAEILESEHSDPVLSPATGSEVRAAFEAPLPRRGRPPAEILEQCRGALRRYSRRSGHPRFFGYVCASAAPLGALADGLASLLNQI
ncbi:MAG: aspartate aminotransferase family protein, partial [bacterium]|nr:aspartate aminotransferase family protein [bacterium]